MLDGCWRCSSKAGRRDRKFAGASSPALGIADPWFALFAEGGTRLGNSFERAAYLIFLTERQGQKGYLRSLSGLVPRRYTEANFLGPIKALVLERRDGYRRQHPRRDPRPVSSLTRVATD